MLQNKVLSRPLAPLLIVLIFVALPFKMSVLNIMISISALFGLGYLLRHPKVYISALQSSGFLLLFLCLWLPIVISASDSLDTAATLKVSGNIARFLFIGIVCLTFNQKALSEINRWVVYLVLFVCVDALAQWLTGYDVLGKRIDSERITGVFGSKFHLGYVVGTLSPLVFLYAGKRFLTGKGWMRFVCIVMVLLVACTVLVSGARSGWISLLVSIILVTLWFAGHGHLKGRIIVALGGALLLLLAAASQLPIVKQRYALSVTKYVGEYTWFDRVTSYRTTMWKVALKEVKKHPINGIGAGSFKTAFDRVDPVEKGYFSAAYLVHLHGLEVLTETGIIGLMGYLYVCGYLLFAIYRERTRPGWLLVAFVAMMPINTHMSLYGSFWAPFVWVALALGVAQCYLVRREDG